MLRALDSKRRIADEELQRAPRERGLPPQQAVNCLCPDRDRVQRSHGDGPGWCRAGQVSDLGQEPVHRHRFIISHDNDLARRALRSCGQIEGVDQVANIYTVPQRVPITCHDKATVADRAKQLLRAGAAGSVDPHGTNHAYRDGACAMCLEGELLPLQLRPFIRNFGMTSGRFVRGRVLYRPVHADGATVNKALHSRVTAGRQQLANRFYVHPVILPRFSQHAQVSGRQVKNGVYPPDDPILKPRITYVAFHGGEPRRLEMADPADVQIDSHDVMPAPELISRQMASDEPSGSCYQNPPRRRIRLGHGSRLATTETAYPPDKGRRRSSLEIASRIG